jgi:hypothetical protein
MEFGAVSINFASLHACPRTFAGPMLASLDT